MTPCMCVVAGEFRKQAHCDRAWPRPLCFYSPQPCHNTACNTRRLDLASQPMPCSCGIPCPLRRTASRYLSAAAPACLQTINVDVSGVKSRADSTIACTMSLANTGMSPLTCGSLVQFTPAVAFATADHALCSAGAGMVTRDVFVGSRPIKGKFHTSFASLYGKYPEQRASVCCSTGRCQT